MRLAPVARRCAARYSPSAPPFFNASQKRDPLLRFGLLQGAAVLPRLRSASGGTSTGVPVPFSTIRCTGYSPEVPSSGTTHVHGFSPSSRVSFRFILSGLVSSRKRSWGSPFRGFPSNGGLKAHRFQVPLLSFPRWPPRPSAGCLGPRGRRLGSTSGACSPFESVRGAEAR